MYLVITLSLKQLPDTNTCFEESNIVFLNQLVMYFDKKSS